MVHQLGVSLVETVQLIVKLWPRKKQNSYSSDAVSKTRSHTTKTVLVTSGINYSGYTYPSSITTNSSGPTLITLNNNSSVWFFG